VVGAPFQASLLDTPLLDSALPDAGPAVRVGPVGAGLRRQDLAGGAWLDLRRRWVAGADTLFERLRDTVPWRAERRPMYDRTVDVPRLLSFYDEGEPLPDPALVAAKRALDEHYAAELGELFATAGLAFYRDGRDSVAWHGDRIGRGSTHDTMVAILVLGAPRALLLRPRAGGPADARRGAAGGATTTIRHELGHGDLLVMGGSCQRTWEHAVPKTARAVGPRVSVQFRPRNVR
jgi:alkylated DNA repair dioxygenase AlkB